MCITFSTQFSKRTRKIAIGILRKANSAPQTVPRDVTHHFNGGLRAMGDGRMGDHSAQACLEISAFISMPAAKMRIDFNGALRAMRDGRRVVVKSTAHIKQCRAANRILIEPNINRAYYISRHSKGWWSGTINGWRCPDV